MNKVLPPRAEAVLEDPAARDQFERLARSAAEAITDDQDREWLLQNLATIE